MSHRRPQTKTIPAADPEFISLAEAGFMTGYSSKTIRRKVAAGELQAFTMGATRSYRVRREDVLALMKPCPAPYIDDEAAARAFG